MIKLNDFLNITEYESGHLEVVNQQDVYGKAAISLEVYGLNSSRLLCVYDIVSQEVLEIMAEDHFAGRTYLWQVEDVKSNDLNRFRNVKIGNIVELETEEDILEKSEAIFNGVPYDTRIIIPLDIRDEDFLMYAKAAHKLDITINEFMEKAIREMVEKLKV